MSNDRLHERLRGYRDFCLVDVDEYGVRVATWPPAAPRAVWLPFETFRWAREQRRATPVQVVREALGLPLEPAR